MFGLTSFLFILWHFCPRIPWYIQVLSPPAPLGWDNFSDFPCFRQPCQFWGALINDFIECPSIEICLMSFSQWDWHQVFPWGRPERLRAIFIISYQGACYQHDFTIHVELDHLTEDVFVRGLHITVNLLSPLPTLYSLEGVTTQSPHFRGRLCSTSLRAEYLP